MKKKLTPSSIRGCNKPARHYPRATEMLMRRMRQLERKSNFQFFRRESSPGIVRYFVKFVSQP